MRQARKSVMRAFVVLVFAVVAASVLGSGATSLQSADEQLIRSARDASNRAIAAHDLPSIARIWMEDVHIVSSTSTQTGGREPNQQRMARQFANRPDTIYVRRPVTIEVYAPWAVA